MRVLLVTNQVKTYAWGFRNMIEMLQGLGHEVVWAANFSGHAGNIEEIPCKRVQIPICSNPLKPANLRAFHVLKRTIQEEKIEALHCSTPIGGMLGRLAAKQTGIGKVIYAAHGFLFYKGAPLINRTVYKWQERLMARWTDVLITITEEDLQAARKFKLRSGKDPYLVHGAGVEIGKPVCVDKKEKRKELDIPEDAFAVLSAGFLNPNKNNRVLIEAVAKIADPNVYYLICGEGAEKTALEALAEKRGIKENVRFLGYRTDLGEIMAASDLFAMPSFREGVPRALLEAMDQGLPCMGADTRGIRELLPQQMLRHPKDADGFAHIIGEVMNRSVCWDTAAAQAKAKQYGNEQIRKELLGIYQKEL